jgi:esterase/lipase superfamily enzyme
MPRPDTTGSGPGDHPGLSRRFVLLSALALGACAGRGSVTIAPDAAATGSVQQILVASARQATADGTDYANRPGRALSFSQFQVSVPPDREPGPVSFPGATPDPRRDFLTVSRRDLADGRAFVAAIDRAAAALPPADREAVIFVHGFNTTFAEGLYRQAQMRKDFGIPGIPIHFSWPSAASVSAYGTDREVALVARDALAGLIGLVTQARLPRVIVAGHSMGAFVVMEAMRQIGLEGRSGVLRRAGTVVLFAPDIDIAVFRRQMVPLLSQDVSVYIFASRRDRALQVSARLRGQPERLGSIADPSVLAGLPVTVIDISDVATRNDSLNHFKVATSPSMISLMQGVDRLTLEAFQSARADAPFVSASAGLVQGVTSIILAPVSPR